ncbi:MAG: DUF2971 domain-containing protein [Candidatus Omnitrophica bacterium]|nr:DUF2971 domain-containing protein [Candidatus Omnitrophota bacterium]
MANTDSKIFYHFLPFKDALYDLKSELIKVSKIRDVNDPFEFLPYLGKKGRYRRKPYYEFKNRISKKFGILCFSGGWQEPLLWGHYADKHRGVALGFKIVSCDLLKVKYVRERPIIGLNNPKNRERFLFNKLLKYKYKKWEYENEYRTSVNLCDCNKIDKHYFFPFTRKLILKKIILGCEWEKNKEVNVIKDLSNKYKADLIVSRMAFRDYRIVKNRSKTREFLPA